MPLEKSVSNELQPRTEEVKNSWLQISGQDAELLNHIFRYRPLGEIRECTAFIEYVLKQSLLASEYEMMVQLDLHWFKADLLNSLNALIGEKKNFLARIILVLKTPDRADLYLADGPAIEHRSPLTLCTEKKLPALFESGLGVIASQYFLLRICRQIHNIMDVLACPHVCCVKWAGSDQEVTIAASGTAYYSTL